METDPLSSVLLALSLFVCVMGVCHTRCHIDEPVSSSSVLLALAEAVAAGVNLPTEALWRLLTFCSALVTFCSSSEIKHAAWCAAMNFLL